MEYVRGSGVWVFGIGAKGEEEHLYFQALSELRSISILPGPLVHMLHCIAIYY
jgi:hypothetical protein